MKVVYKGPLSPFTGYGNDGIGLVKAMLRANIDVRIKPTSINVPLPPEIAYTLTLGLEAPFDLVINHVDPYQLEASPGEAYASDFVLGWSMWERTELYPTDPYIKEEPPWRQRLDRFDAILCYDDVSHEAISKVTGDVPTLVLQGGADFELWTKSKVRDWYGPMRFIMVGQLHERKCPFLSVFAFHELRLEGYLENACLTLKTTTAGLHPLMENAYPGLKIIHEHMSQEDLRDKIYHQAHVLLAPSKGEGKNMPALEFMATGGTVIATNWGGHTQWMRNDIAYPLNYELAPESAVHPNAMEARPSKEHLKVLMLHAYNNRDQARQRGELASKIIPQTKSWDRVLEDMFLRLEHLSKGRRLREKYLEACASPNKLFDQLKEQQST